jgi:hypothetical protein
MPRTASTSQTSRLAKPALDKSTLRSRIIEEYHLQQSIARDEEFRRDHPDLWQRADDARIARNKAQAELNRRLRAAGCRPVMMEPSLMQKMKKLRQLQARNRAETASLRKRP